MNPIPKNAHFIGDHSLTDWLHLRDRLYQVSQKTNRKAHLLVGIATPCFEAIDTAFNLITATVSCLVDGGKATWKGEWKQHRKKGSWPLIKAYFAFLSDHYSFAGRCAWAALGGCVLRGFWDAKRYGYSLPTTREVRAAQLLQTLSSEGAHLDQNAAYYQKILQQLPPDSDLLGPIYSRLITLKAADGATPLNMKDLLTQKDAHGVIALEKSGVLEQVIKGLDQLQDPTQAEILGELIISHTIPNVAKLKKPEVFSKNLPLLKNLPHKLRLKLLYESQALVMEEKDWTRRAVLCSKFSCNDPFFNNFSKKPPTRSFGNFISSISL